MKPPPPATVDDLEPGRNYLLAEIAPLVRLTVEALRVRIVTKRLPATRFGNKWLVRGAVVRDILGLPEKVVRRETRRERVKRGRAVLDRLKAKLKRKSHGVKA